LPYNLLVKNGRLIDGSGAPWVWADIVVQGEKITNVSGTINAEAETVIDAKGLCVSPGWIDIHMHADHTVLGNPLCESYIHQGVTTATMGNCGLSMYPLLESHREDLIMYLKPFTSGLDLDWGWATLEDFTNRVMDSGVAINLVPLVGHGSIRINVMGFSDKDPTAADLNSMKRLLEDSLMMGAFGMSSGLGYPPGVFTRDRELVELCKVLRKYGGIYATHMRGNLENLKDTIRVGEEAGVPVQVSHIGSSCASHKPLSGRHEETTLRWIDEARQRGVDITADIYPYIAGSSLLSQLIPDWAHEGGVSKMLERISDPDTRLRIEKEYKAEGSDAKGRDFTKVLMTYAKSEGNKKYEGMTIAEIAEQRGVPEVDALCDLLLEEKGEAMNVSFWGVEEDVTTLVRHHTVMPCSDGWIRAPYGQLGSGKPHPRCYGAFPRYLRKYVREQEIFPIEEAVRRMTSMPAHRLGLYNRGLIREGFIADLTVFNPETVKDNATYSEPHRYPDGVPYVIVNGEVTIRDGEHTGALNGSVLKRRV
jgi:N-acyl-D-amino-acid deacylase